MKGPKYPPVTVPEWERIVLYPKVGIAGDWHGNARWARAALHAYADNDVHVVYHLGDFGFWPGESGTAYLTQVQALADIYDQLILVTPGNHEDYNQIDAWPVDPDTGFAPVPGFPRIWVIPRGTVWDHAGTMLASLGGAGSIDVRRRELDTSWWPQEAITTADVDALERNLTPYGTRRVDVMLAHESPADLTMRTSMFVAPEIEYYVRESRIHLSTAVAVARPRWFLHGHWHYWSAREHTFADMNGDEFTTRVVGLDMDGTAANLIVVELAPMAGIVEMAVLVVTHAHLARPGATRHTADELTARADGNRQDAIALLSADANLSKWGTPNRAQVKRHHT